MLAPHRGNGDPLQGGGIDKADHVIWFEALTVPAGLGAIGFKGTVSQAFVIGHIEEHFRGILERLLLRHSEIGDGFGHTGFEEGLQTAQTQGDIRDDPEEECSSNQGAIREEKIPRWGQYQGHQAPCGGDQKKHTEPEDQAMISHTTTVTRKYGNRNPVPPLAGMT